MHASAGVVFGVVAQVQKRVQRCVRDQPYIASAPAVAARRSAARDKLLAAKGRDAVTAMASLNPNFDPINKHSDSLSDLRFQIPNSKP